MVTTWLNRRTRREKEDVGVGKRGGREAKEEEEEEAVACSL